MNDIEEYNMNTQFDWDWDDQTVLSHSRNQKFTYSTFSKANMKKP